MLDIARQYMRRHGGAEAAVIHFVADLMRGDPATFKAGYSRESAVLAAADAFDLEARHIRRIVDESAVVA